MAYMEYMGILWHLSTGANEHQRTTLCQTTEPCVSSCIWGSCDDLRETNAQGHHVSLGPLQCTPPEIVEVKN